MKKLFTILVIAVIALTLVSLPAKAIAEPQPKVEVVVEKVEDINIGVDYQVFIPASSTLALVNNNPGNLRFVGQKFARKGYGGFAYFNTPELGFLALKNQIALDASRGLTIGKFVHKFAPSFENDTILYISQLIMQFDVDENTKLSDIPVNYLAMFIMKKESGSILLP